METQETAAPEKEKRPDKERLTVAEETEIAVQESLMEIRIA